MKSITSVENGVVHTLCRQCSHHCGVYVHIQGGIIEKITANKDHYENQGFICPKGRIAPEWVYHPERLTGCLKRTSRGDFKSISYGQALDEIAERMLEIKKQYGSRAMSVWTGEAIGFAQQQAYAQRFITAFGSPNHFTADSVCYASRYMAYESCQGYWSEVADFVNGKLTILWGSNPGISHPPYMQRISKAKKKGGKLVVVDPRRSAAAKRADLHLRIRPGTDAALALGLIRLLIDSDAYDHDFVEKFSVGFDDLASYSAKFSMDYVAAQTGLSEKEISILFELICQSKPKTINYMGISMEHQINGFNTTRSVACLSALCGAVDIEGGEPWFKGLPLNSLSLFDLEKFKNMDPVGHDEYPLFCEKMLLSQSLTGIDYMLGKGKHPLKGLIFSGANPVLTNPNAGKVSKSFAGLDLLVARDLFMTESAKLADYIIPAASFLERSELHVYAHLHRVGLSQKVLDVEGVWDEYTFWRDLANRLGFGESYFPWKDEREVNKWLLEPSGVSLEDLEKKDDGIVYESSPTYRQFETRPFPTPSGKFEFFSTSLEQMGLLPLAEYVPPDYLGKSSLKFPLQMITGARRPMYYHSRFREIKKFQKQIPCAIASIHPEDAEPLGISSRDLIRIISSIGQITILAEVVSDDDILKGVIEVPHGWDASNVNVLTDDHETDPCSGYPNMKIVPVRIEKI